MLAIWTSVPETVSPSVGWVIQWCQ